MAVPIIDLFAGPGGLGEGFSQIGWREGAPFFKIGLSVEKEASAHRTLKLRSFLRQFPYNKIPKEYFSYIREGKNTEELFSLKKYAVQAQAAENEAWNATLRNEDDFNKELDVKITRALNGRKDWVLIGGPPCQAYSLAGRVRNKGKDGYTPEKDGRHFLYQEYLRIIAVHSPAVFVMENVKGLLSSKVNGNAIFKKIMQDLRKPSNGDGCQYRIFSLLKEPDIFDENGDPVFEDKDFVIEAERYGIPQSRHRVILLGVREDLARKGVRPTVLDEANSVSLYKVLTLPSLRSGISRGNYDGYDWLRALREFPIVEMREEICRLAGQRVLDRIFEAIQNSKVPKADMGNAFVNKIPGKIIDSQLADWYEDERIQGVFNHSARTHMKSDLHRYLYAACFAKVKGYSPKMSELPELLKPDHKNKDTGHFNDRFRVQVTGRPACTVTSHISKDGHYYIHPSPEQCRSLSVREAARIQTFPDNYFFCGNRTEQYVQVGNAVPPLLAYKVAFLVKDLLKKAFVDID